MHLPERGALGRPSAFQDSPMASETPPPWRRRRRRSILPLILLAVLSVVVACDTDRGAPPTNEQPPGAPEPLAPRGAVSLPFSFTWKAVPGGDWIYRVIVTDAAERPMFQADVRSVTTMRPSSELRAMMAEEHATFIWSVAIVNSGGHILARSAQVQFSLK